MKKLMATLVLVALPFSAALADNDIGCGFGTQIWAGQSGLVAKVLGATTNGSTANQTFGISSGTLGCSQDGVVKAELRRAQFASANLDQLAAEVAAGEGESLNTLAALYNVAAADRAAFNVLAQQHYGALFATTSATTGDVLAALEKAMSADARFAAYVA